MLREVSFIIGSMIGPGIFFLPFNISRYGSSGIISLFLSSVFFLVLGNYFSNYPSPFYLIEKKLGTRFCFFIGWAYWITSWLSSIVVINEISIYFCDLFCVHSFKLLFEILLLSVLTISNLFGVKNSLKLETWLSLAKIIPLIVIPIIFITYGKGNIPLDIRFNQVLGGLLPTVWCFSGIETMGFVAKSKKTFITSMAIITFVYVVNVFSVFYFYSSFAVEPTSYSQIMYAIYGSAGSKVLKVVILVESISNLNSWILSSGLCAHDLSQKGLMPESMKKLNQYQSPQTSIITSSLCLGVLIVLSQSQQAALMISSFTEISCNLFLVFYASFSLACLIEEKSIITFLMFLISIGICFMSQNFLLSLVAIACIMISGIPVFFKQKIK
jgi:APA family basic amino acid/polyamine antiporter